MAVFASFMASLQFIIQLVLSAVVETRTIVVLTFAVSYHNNST